MVSAEAVMANLSSLTKLSKTVNEESNQVNKLLQDLERKLADMNLGVEVWLSDLPLTSRIRTESNDQDDEWKTSTDEVLGFGQLHDKPMLMVKTDEYIEVINSFGQKEWDLRHDGSPRPLLSASRELRIKALDRVADLLNALELEANKVIASIQAGKSIIEKL